MQNFFIKGRAIRNWYFVGTTAKAQGSMANCCVYIFSRLFDGQLIVICDSTLLFSVIFEVNLNMYIFRDI